jgi:hypothetical protein
MRPIALLLLLLPGLAYGQTLLPGKSIATVQPGNTSCASTWGGTLPTAADDVLILHDVTIDKLEANRVEIASGTATLVDADLHGSLLVRSTLVGSAGELRFHVADDRTFKSGTVIGPLPGLPGLHIDDVGLWGLPGSTITLDAGDKTSWASCTPIGHQVAGPYGLFLADAYGPGTATLDRDLVGWEPGDAMELCDEKGNHVRATLATVDGRTITYTGADNFTAKILTAGSHVAAPKIANLSRKLRIISADVKPGDTNHRAHTAILGDCKATFRGVEFRDLGTRGMLGRYPTHWHMNGATAGLLDSCAIWSTSDPGNRFLSLHHCQGVTVTDNIGLYSRGHGYFFEDGHETNNTMVGNLSIDVTGPEEIPNVDSSRTTQPHHFWTRAGNVVEGNVAVGGNAVGCVVLPILCKECAKPFIGVRHQVLGQECYGGGKYGVWSTQANVDFVGGLAVYAELAGFAADASWGSSSSGVAVSGMLLAMNGNTSADPYISQAYLNRTATGIKLADCSIHGKKAIHVHYNVTASLDACSINVGTLLTPTYWESQVAISGSDITAAKAFDRAYPKRQNKIGWLRITDSTYTLGTLSGDEDLEFIGLAFKSTAPGVEFGGAWRVSR